MSALKMTANQYVLLGALKRAAGLVQPEVPEVKPELTPVFPSQRAWLAAATALYLRLWPGGSNPERGPRKALPSVVGKGWVTQAQRGRALVPRLTAAGAEVLQAVDASIVRPKYVLDVLAEIREQRLAAAVARLAAHHHQPTNKES